MRRRVVRFRIGNGPISSQYTLDIGILVSA
jgi:hypothetical protein